MKKTKHEQKSKPSFSKKEIDIVILFISISAIVVSAIIISLELFYLSPNTLCLGINAAIIVASIFSIIRFINKYLYADLSSKEDRSTVALIVFAFAIIITLSAILGEGYHRRDQNQFKVPNSKESQSPEFLIIKKMADENNVYMRFGSLNTSWANTRLQIPNGSGASLYLKNGFCELNYNDESIRSMKKAYLNGNPALFNNKKVDIPKLAIMAHEFGHCIDIKRDLAVYNLDQVDPNNPKKVILSAHAIHPSYRKNINEDDLFSYLDAMRYSTLWKEVFSDIYSIGLLYITHPDIADEANQGLITFRKKTAEFDPFHDTSCWLGLIDQTVKPKSENELIEWADSIRNSKTCLSVLNKHLSDKDAIY